MGVELTSYESMVAGLQGVMQTDFGDMVPSKYLAYTTAQQYE